MRCYVFIFNCNKVPKSFSNFITLVSDKTIGIYIFHFNLLDISFIMADYLGWNNWSRKGYFLFCDHRQFGIICNWGLR